jgi:photosystem II stability/assembly factor-like uncharacterized protein
MNRKQSLLAGLGVAILGLTSWYVQPSQQTNPKLAQWMKEESLHEMEEIAGARNYETMIRANQETHQIRPEDLQEAISDIQSQEKWASKKTRAFGNVLWQNMGPNNFGGRTRAVIVDRDSANKLFMGGVNGGMFVSRDNGGSWEKIPGNDSSYGNSVASICQAANGDIYYGTGEGFYASSGQFGTGQVGTGIYKSSDHGLTFQRLSATIPASNSSGGNWVYINGMAAHPTDPNKIYAAASHGLFISSNGGTSWAKPSNLVTNAMFHDVEISADGMRVVASTATAIFISNDGGTTFSTNIMGATGTGLPTASSFNRIEVDIAPSNKDYLYAVTVSPASTGGQSLQGVYKSTDGGATWSKILAGGSTFGASDVLGNQGVYDLAFAVHPTNPELIFLGGQLSMYRYVPGTATNQGWVSIAYWQGSSFAGNYIHADMHAVVFNHENPEEMYVVCDGGFFKTNNSSNVDPIFVEKGKNYITAQPYGVSANYLGNYMIGCQDNGVWITGEEANSQYTGRKLLGGDGTRSYMSDLVPDYVFGCIIEGELKRAGDGGQNGSSFTSIFDQNVDSTSPGSNSNNPDEKPDDNASWEQWIMPFDVKEAFVDGEPRGNMVIGTNKNVFLTQDALDNNPVWFRITNNQLNSQFVSFSAITLSKDGKTIFAGTSNGLIYRYQIPSVWLNKYQHYDTISNIAPTTTDFPLKSQIVGKLVYSTGGRFVTDVECDSLGNNLVVTLGNYNNSNYVYYSTNAQDSLPTFNVIDGNLPNMPVYSAIMVKGNPQEIMLGTDFGIWGTSNAGSTWIELNRMSPDPKQWHPRLAVHEIIQKKECYDGPYNNRTPRWSDVIIYTASHGRGVFRTTSLAKEFPTGTINTGRIEELSVYPNPCVQDIHIRYQAISSSTVQVRIMSITGTILRTLSTPVTAGSNIIDINTSSLAAGQYIISLTDRNSRGATTFIKK